MDKKVERIINLYSRLMEGEYINKRLEASRFDVSVRTIQRDIDDIRSYLTNDMVGNRRIEYKRNKNGYALKKEDASELTGKEVLIACKVLLGSSSLLKEEIFPIIDKLVGQLAYEEEKKKVISLIANEKFHYEEAKHGKLLKKMMWDIGNAMQDYRLIRLAYQKDENTDVVERIIQPTGIIFMQGYFYLTAYIAVGNKADVEQLLESDGKTFPAVYRLDWVKEYHILEEHFRVPYRDRFQDGEFRKLFNVEMAEEIGV